METANTLYMVEMPPRIAVHEDLSAAVRSRDWVAVKEAIAFFAARNVADAATVLHWMIQEADIATSDVLYFADTIYGRPINALVPIAPTLLQRALAANRIDVMTALIERGHQLCHDMRCPLAANPLLTALHPAVSYETCAALLRYYTLPPNNAFARYAKDDVALAFYVPIARERMVLLKAAGIDVHASRLALLAGEPTALDYTGAKLAKHEDVLPLLRHYLAVRNFALCVYVAHELITPFADPALAAAVLRANHGPLVRTLVRTLKLDEPIVAERKSAMLIAAEANAADSCRALMDAGISATFEERDGGIFAWSSISTAHSAAAKHDAALAAEIASYADSTRRKGKAVDGF